MFWSRRVSRVRGALKAGVFIPQRNRASRIILPKCATFGQPVFALKGGDGSAGLRAKFTIRATRNGKSLRQKKSLQPADIRANMAWLQRIKEIGHSYGKTLKIPRHFILHWAFAQA